MCFIYTLYLYTFYTYVVFFATRCKPFYLIVLMQTFTHAFTFSFIWLGMMYSNISTSGYLLATCIEGK